MPDPTPVDAIVARLLAGEAPEHLRSAAARGALPLPRAALVRIQVTLLEDSAEEIRATARASLEGLDTAAIGEAISGIDCAPEVIAHFADRALKDEKLAEQVAFHPSSPPSALALLAARGNAHVLDLVMTNQETLLRNPALLDKLMINPALRADQRGRLLEMLERATRARERQSEAEGQEGSTGDPALDGDEVEAAARLLDVDVGELLSASEILGGDEFEQSDDLVIRSAYQKIISLTTAQKAILAMKGGREERTILIRDSNKVVSLGVLKNPRLNENEVEAVAKMRNVSEEVLRQVASHREWSRSYSIVVSLVHNPKTPQSLSSNFVNRLNNRDLKNILTNRDIPELIRRMAKRTYETRTQQSRTNFKKKR